MLAGSEGARRADAELRREYDAGPARGEPRHPQRILGAPEPACRGKKKQPRTLPAEGHGDPDHRGDPGAPLKSLSKGPGLLTEPTGAGKEKPAPGQRGIVPDPTNHYIRSDIVDGEVKGDERDRQG